MRLHYATEETPARHRGQRQERRGRCCATTPSSSSPATRSPTSTSTDLVEFHHDKGALVTVCLTRVPDPLEFGITIVDEDGRVRALPGEAHLGPGVLRHRQHRHLRDGAGGLRLRRRPARSVDWSGDVFPQLLEEGEPIYGYVAEGYWEDVGTHESYLRAQADVLSGKVDVEHRRLRGLARRLGRRGRRRRPGRGAQGPALHRRLRQGRGRRRAARVHRARQQRRRQERRLPAPGGRPRQRLHRPADQPARLRHRQEHRHHARRPDRGGRGRRRRVRRRGGGDRHRRRARSTRSRPSRPAPSSTPSVIWESRGQRTLFGPRGVSGIVNVEITPELAVRLAQRLGDHAARRARPSPRRVTCSRAARALKRAVIAALTSSAIDVRRPRGRRRCRSPGWRPRRARAGGVVIRTTPGQPGERRHRRSSTSTAPTSRRPAQRKLERVFCPRRVPARVPRRDRRPDLPAPGHGGLRPRAAAHASTRRGVAEAGLKVVVDTGGGTASLVLPTLLGRLGVDALTVNNGLDETSPDRDRRRAAARRCSGSAGWSRRSQAAFGVRFDPVGERLSLVDERGPCDRRRAGAARRPRPGGGRAPTAARWRCRSPRPGSPSRSPRSTASTSRGSRPSPDDLSQAAAERPASSSAATAAAASSCREFSHARRRHRGVRPAGRPGRPHPAARCPRSTRASRSAHVGAPDRCRRRGRPRAW